jgi:hypothetical protein
MELERTGNHHAALTRNVPLDSVNDVSYFARHDPMRLPDAHLRRNDMTVGAVTAEREGLNRARNNDDVSEWYERSRPKRVRSRDRGTRKDRDYKYASYPESEATSSSDSDTIIEPPRYSRREDEERRRERDPYYEQPRRREDSARAFHMEDRSHKMQTRESSMRDYDYIERSRGVRQYQEPVRRPSPRRVSTKDKVEYIKRSEGRLPVMVRRGSGKSGSASREPAREPEEELPEEARRVGITPYPQTLEDPRIAYSMQPDPVDAEEFTPAPMRRVEEMPSQLQTHPSQLNGNARRERESTRKSPGSRMSEVFDEFPSPSPEPNFSQEYGRPYAYNFEGFAPDSYPYRTDAHVPVAAAESRRVTGSIDSSPNTGRRPGIVCQTVSRDETSSQGAKNSSYMKMALEPHVRKAQLSKVSGSDASSRLPSRNASTTLSKNERFRPIYARDHTYVR